MSWQEELHARTAERRGERPTESMPVLWARARRTIAIGRRNMPGALSAMRKIIQLRSKVR